MSPSAKGSSIARVGRIITIVERTAGIRSLDSESLLVSVDIVGLRNLPVAEKLRIVTELWDDIAASSKGSAVPPDVLREAVHRSAVLKADPSIAIDDAELWRRVDG